MNSKELQMMIINMILMIVGPFISIWSINLLFGLGIAYSIETWLSMLWLQLILSAKTIEKVE